MIRIPLHRGIYFFACVCSLTGMTKILVAEQSVLVNLISTSQAVVSIEATTGTVYGDKPKAFIHKESGQLMVHRKMTPVVHTRKGTGMLIDSSGIIVTNAHTIIQANRIAVTLQDKSKYSASLVGILPEQDLAFLKINSENPLPFCELSDSNSIRLEDRVYSIGGSMILKNTISEGIISGIGVRKHQKPGAHQYVDLIQVNFDLYHGDSGSPLLNPDGKLLGIMAASAINRSKVAYAIPSNKIGFAIKKFSQTISEKEAA